MEGGRLIGGRLIEVGLYFFDVNPSQHRLDTRVEYAQTDYR